MAWRMGVDIGGTFTDVAVVDEASGRLGVAKVATTPGELATGVLAALRSAMREQEIAGADVGLLSHATTVVTNAVLENKGARAALVTTRGFRDVLELRRSARADLYDLFQDPPAVLIPRRRRFEITERLAADGRIVTPLADSEIAAVIGELRAAQVEAVAVVLLFSFLNPTHEERLGARLRAELPGVAVYLSCEVLPEIKEFERTSTAAVCAAVGPLLASYLARLEAATRAEGLPRLHVMGSSGGMLETPDVLAMPALAVESGPAAGVVAAALVARQKGRANLLSFDMGGTTAKASLIRDGRFETTSEYEIGGGGNVTRFMNGTGHPIRVPVIDLAEVSAGGGSIAWVDRAGALRVGPQSSGALPGPVCYQRGGSEPTVTDCSLILGYLDQTSLLAGGLPISQAAAAAAVEERLARPLGIDARAAAAAVIAIVNHAMAEALKIVSVKRGWDPREFALLAFGGAGPLHAAALAQELGMAEVICPPIPGAFSALGLVAGDIKRDYVRSVGASTTAAEPARLTEAFAALEAEGTALLERARVAPDQRRLERAVDARYPRQSYELTIPVPDRPLDRAALEEVAQAFHERHQRTYGHAHRDEPVELVSLRLAAIGSVPRLRLRAPVGEPRRAPKSRRAAYFADGGLCSAAVWDRAHLVPSMSIAGPAIIESLDSTVLVPPRWHADTDADGFLFLRRSPASGGHA